MTNKQRLLNLRYKHDLSYNRIARATKSNTYQVARWCNREQSSCSPSNEQLKLLEHSLRIDDEKTKWRGKTGIEAVIANMYALERM